MSATLVSGSGAGIVISTSSVQTCNVIIGVNTTYYWTVSLSYSSPYKAVIASYWACDNSGSGTGLNCSTLQNTPLVQFTTSSMDGYIAAHTINGTSASYSQTTSTGLHLPTVFANDGFMNVLFWVLAVIILLSLIACVVSCCFRCRKAGAASQSSKLSSDEF